MRTTLDIDGRLLKEAMARAGLRTKTQTVEQGLRELINTERRRRLLLAGGSGYGVSLRSFLRHRGDE